MIQRLPPCGMASIAFMVNASSTCSICAASARTDRQSVAGVHVDLDGRHLQFVQRELHHAIDDRVHLNPLQVDGIGAREAEQVLDEVATAAALGGDEVEVFRHLVRLG